MGEEHKAFRRIPAGTQAEGGFSPSPVQCCMQGCTIGAGASIFEDGCWSRTCCVPDPVLGSGIDLRLGQAGPENSLTGPLPWRAWQSSLGFTRAGN